MNYSACWRIPGFSPDALILRLRPPSMWPNCGGSLNLWTLQRVLRSSSRTQRTTRCSTPPVAGDVDVLCTPDRHFYTPNVLEFCKGKGIRVMDDVLLLRELLLETPGKGLIA
jgi:hypothetical protein